MLMSINRRTIVRMIIWAALIVGLPAGLLLFTWLVTLPDVAVLAKSNPTSTNLMESRQAEAREDGRPVARQWTWVPLSRISPHLQRAVIAAEDAAFVSHDGFDWTGIKDAAWHNLGTGSTLHGGSTITQQLAKNLYLSPERSWFRKAREALITRSLERHLTKERILELYLNVVEWGNGVYGAEAAAQHHFGTSAAELTLDEAAWLAAILPAPLRHDPIKKTAALTRKQQHVLRWIHKVSTPTARTPGH